MQGGKTRFRRLNVIDLVIIFVVLAVAGKFVYARYVARVQSDIADREQTIEVTFVVSGVRPTTVEAIQRSKGMFEFKTGAYIGDVVKVESQPAQIYFLNEDGRWVRTTSEDRRDAFVTVRGKARMGENVITMNGVEVRVGSSIGLKSKWVAINTYVLTIDTEVADSK